MALRTRDPRVSVMKISQLSLQPSDVKAMWAPSGGPPPEVPTTGLQMLLDESQGTAVVLQFFDTAEDMQAGDQAFGAMDPTPGTRASVDMCELKLERRVSG